ncbi:MAG TPA: type II secretion system protein GspN [Kofleriaceae bacterium]|jgi:type II secretion system protein N
MAIPLGPRQRLILRYVGIAVAALVVFVLALQATFPYDRVRDKIVEALAPSYDVQINGIERGILPGSVTFKSVTLTSRPSKPGEVSTVLFVDSIHVDVGVLALIGMTASVDLDVKLGVGRIKGNISLPKFGRGGFHVDVTATNVPGRDIPLGEWGMPPVIGKLDASIDLTVPMTKTKAGREIRDWTKADGTIALSCPSDCSFGDGKTKMKPLLKNRSQQAMVGDGIEFGKLSIDSLAIEGKFTPAVGSPDEHSSSYKPGKFDVTKFELKSKDGELHVDYSMTLAPELDESIVTGCLRFNVNESLLKTDEGKKTYAAVSTSGAEKRSDGLFHIKLADHLKDMKRFNLECGPNAKPTTEEGSGPRGVMRPTIHPPPPERPEPKPFKPAEPAEPPKPAEPSPKFEAKPGETKVPDKAEGSAGSAAAPAGSSEQGSAPDPQADPQQPAPVIQ